MIKNRNFGQKSKFSLKIKIFVIFEILSIHKLELDKPVITPSLYGPKFTHLQNTIEFHHPDLHEDCGRGLIGQLGDSGTCGKWLRTRETTNSRAKLVFAIEDSKVSFCNEEFNVSLISAKIDQSYDEQFLIDSAYRQIVKVGEIVFISDFVKLDEESKITKI